MQFGFLVMAAGLVLAFAWLVWQLRREQRTEPADPAVVAYRRLCRRLAAIGLARRPHEGAEGYAARIGRARPDLAAAVAALCGSYSRLRYAQASPEDGADLEAFVARARESRHQPARRQRPRQPDRHAGDAQQPVQSLPGGVESGEQGVNLAVPAAAPGAGPCRRLLDRPAAPRAGRGQVPVTLLAHGEPHHDSK